MRFSIHSDGNWLFTAKQATIPITHRHLAPGLHFPDTKWVHVAEIDFYSNETSLPPEITPDKHTIGILVPKAYKLIVNLWLNPHGSTARPKLPKRFDGTVIWKTQLRHSGAAGAIARVLPLTGKDAEHIAFFERERPTEIFFTGAEAPVADLEMFRHHFHPIDGNVIQVYPLPQSTLVRKYSDEF